MDFGYALTQRSPLYGLFKVTVYSNFEMGSPGTLNKWKQDRLTTYRDALKKKDQSFFIVQEKKIIKNEREIFQLCGSRARKWIHVKK